MRVSLATTAWKVRTPSSSTNGKRLWLPCRECNDEWKPLHSQTKATETLAGSTPAPATIRN